LENTCRKVACDVETHPRKHETHSGIIRGNQNMTPYLLGDLNEALELLVVRELRPDDSLGEKKTAAIQSFGLELADTEMPFRFFLRLRTF
jgi:hypothetical protein